jgi:integrase
MARLTQAKLRDLINKPGRHGDGQGLFLRSLGEGKSYWAYRYRSPDPTAGGKEREMSLGPYPEVSLVEARIRHAELRKQVIVDRVDPSAEKRAAREIVREAAAAPKAKARPTFGAVADQYIRDNEASWKNAVHRRQWRQTLGEPCEAIRDMPVDEIDTAAVLSVLKPIWTATPETASRLRARIEAVLASAQVDGLIDERQPNPARWKGWLALKLPNPRAIGERSGHAAMPYADLPAFMARVKATPGEAAKALALAILTAARTSEVIGMTFAEIDTARAVWTVPASRMKMAREHAAPLSDAAMHILKGQIEARGPEQTYVFESPARAGKVQPLSNMAMSMTLRRLGAGAFTVHGFRASFRTWCADTGIAFELAEAALAHSSNALVASYQRSAMIERRRPVMAAWAVFLAGEGDARILPFARPGG